MPLTKISTPTYELELPSTGKKIKYRPFLVREEKILILALESEDEKQIATAVKNTLKVSNSAIEDLELIEANEAFAAQSIAVNKELGWDTNKVNVNGGAIAIGHPIGASGARILVTLLHQMKRQDAKKGLATLCIGGGMGIALCVER